MNTDILSSVSRFHSDKWIYDEKIKKLYCVRCCNTCFYYQPSLNISNDWSAVIISQLFATYFTENLAWQTTMLLMTTMHSISRERPSEASTTGRISRSVQRWWSFTPDKAGFALCPHRVIFLFFFCFLGHHRAHRSPPLPCRWTLWHSWRQLETKLWCQRGIFFSSFLNFSFKNLRELAFYFSWKKNHHKTL